MCMLKKIDDGYVRPGGVALVCHASLLLTIDLCLVAIPADRGMCQDYVGSVCVALLVYAKTRGEDSCNCSLAQPF